MILVIFSLFLQLPISMAQDSQMCMVLEGSNLGCIPSTAHPCFMNRPCSQGAGDCVYGREIDQYWRNVTGPIDFRCADYEDPPQCPPGSDVCNPGQGRCLTYYPPTCREKCDYCHPDYRTYPQPQGGCVVCTRPRCPFEPDCSVGRCPPTHPDNPELPLGFLDRCQPSTRCPTTATDPNGVVHQVQVTSTDCGPQPTPPPTPPPTSAPPACPWEVDPFPGLTHASQCPPSYPPPPGWVMPPAPATPTPSPTPGR